MTASVTNNFKSFQATAVASAIKNQSDSESLYIYTAWADAIDGIIENDVIPPTPTLSSLEFASAYANMLTMHKIPSSGVSQVTKRVNWVENTIYAQFSQLDYSTVIDLSKTDGLNAFDNYVIAEDVSSGASRLNVYKCLFTPYESNAYKPSIIRPSGTSVGTLETADGYVWKFMYTITTSDSLRFLTENSMPVPDKVSEAIEDIPPGNARRDQFNVENNAVPGELYSLTILNNDVSALNILDGVFPVNFQNEGIPTTSANFRVVIENNIITNIIQINPGAGYAALTTSNEIVTPSGNVDITGHLIANIAPTGGHGFNAINELEATSTTINVRIVHDTSGDIATQNDFRQIGIIRNPIAAVTNRVGTKNEFILTYKLTITSAFTSINEDSIILGVNGARMRVVGFGNNGLDIYVNSIGAIEPDPAVQISPENDPGDLKTVSITTPEIVTNSGDLLYIENRKPLNRSPDQVESFNITFEF